MIQSGGHCIIIGQVLTIYCQEWIINVTFVLMHPGLQFGLDINCSSSRVALVQHSGADVLLVTLLLSANQTKLQWCEELV